MISKSGRKARLISESSPERYVVTVLSSDEICRSTEKFFSDNFRGAISLTLPEHPHGYVLASAEGIAYFFKVLLNAVFGKSVVEIKMSCDSEILTLRTEWKKEKELSTEVIDELWSIARASAFGFKYADDGSIARLDLLLSIHKLNFIPIYATDSLDMHEAYVKVFFLI